MNDLKSIYIEEANELLANLEISLLSLESNITEKKYIEEIFRVMHTLKGNSSMFGLQNVAEFVHDLETIYDKVRNDEIKLNKELLNVSFLSLDHLKLIIHDSELINTVNKETHSKLLLDISKHSNSETPNIKKETHNDANSKKTYYVLFEPNENIFSNGTNPLYLVNELTALGNSICIPHFKINSSEIEALDKCFTYWEIILETTSNENEIRDIFVFVEDKSNIKIVLLKLNNIINNADFINETTSNIYNDIKIDINELENEFKSNNLMTTEVISQTAEEQANHVNPIKETKNIIERKEKSVSSIRVASDKLDELMNLVSELVTTQAALSMFSNNNNINELDTIAENVEKLSRRLRDIAFGMTLVPINNMFGRFQRMVRDVAASLGKEIEFITEGGETELDKSIIETLTDPLMHILRNSIDHGIETIEKRLEIGKSKSGKVTLKAFYSGVYVYIQITDDGKGIDKEVIRKKAISKGLIKNDDIITEEDIFDLIFLPGFSTAEKITDVSGRGVGMDVVKRNITELKGTIKVESTVNIGTTLTIKLPLTLSIIDGLLVSIDKVNYIIPLSVIKKCYLVNNSDMHNNFNKLLNLDEEQVPFINTREQFGHSFESTGKSQIIVVQNDKYKVGLSVDNIIGEYQAVIKPLGKYYKNQDFISGASILGDGTIALVLDSNKIIEIHTKKTKMEDKQ